MEKVNFWFYNILFASMLSVIIMLVSGYSDDLDKNDLASILVWMGILIVTVMCAMYTGLMSVHHFSRYIAKEEE